MTFCRLTAAALLVSGMLADTATSAESVPTHHYDSYRTGWNSRETTLNPSVLTLGKFGVLKKVELDDQNDQVDAHPLIVADQPIEGKGTHTVVYVATANNTIYALDAYSGAQLAKLQTVDTLAPPTAPLYLGDHQKRAREQDWLGASGWKEAQRRPVCDRPAARPLSLARSAPPCRSADTSPTA